MDTTRRAGSPSEFLTLTVGSLVMVVDDASLFLNDSDASSVMVNTCGGADAVMELCCLRPSVGVFPLLIDVLLDFP